MNFDVWQRNFEIGWADLSIESWFNIQISGSPPAANSGFVRFGPKVKASKSGNYFQNVIDLKHKSVQKKPVVAEEVFTI